MCRYCGKSINDARFELYIDDEVLGFCGEECAILYNQEQQQRHFQTWVSVTAR